MKVNIGNTVTVLRPVEAMYSGYAGNPYQWFQPGQHGEVVAVMLPKLRRMGGSDYFVSVAFTDTHGKPWRVAVCYKNIAEVSQ